VVGTGRVIADRFKVVRPLGQGTGGRVFLVRDQAHDDESLALKLLARGGRLRDERFRHEFAMLSTVEHPNLARARDFGESKSGFFYTAEAVDGDPFDRWMSNPRRTAAEALRVAGEALSALDALHARGLSHGDIRAGNILVSPRGAKLIDAGIAASSARDDVRRFGAVLRDAAGPRLATDRTLGRLIERLTSDAPGEAIVDAATALALVGREPASIPVFIGRDAELKRLMAAQVAFVHGVEGCGRTALVERLRIRAQLDGVIVGVGRPTPRPLEAVERLFEELAPAGVKPRLIHGRYRSPIELKMALTEALMEASRRHRLIIIVEDLHELDADSFALAVHFADILRLADGTKCQVVLTWRDAELASAGRSVTVPTAEEIVLGPLDAGALVAARLGGVASAALAAELDRVTEGNARLLNELVDQQRFSKRDGVWEAAGPIEITPDGAFDLLAPAERDLAAVLAASVIPLTRDQLSRIVAPSTLDDTLERLIRSGWVRPGFRVASPARRRAVPERVRARWHQPIAFGIESMGGKPSVERLHAMSHHWLAAGNAQRGLPFGLRMAELLLKRNAAAQAAGIYEQCAKLAKAADRRGLLERAREAWHRAGDFTSHIAAARRVVEFEKDFASLFAAGEALRDAGEIRPSLTTFREAGGAARTAEERALALAEEAIGYGTLREMKPLGEMAEKLEEVATAVPRVTARLWMVKAFVATGEENVNAIFDAIDKAIRAAKTAGDPFLQWRAWNGAILATGFGNPRYYEPEPYLKRASQIAERAGFSYEAERSLGAMNTLDRLRGQVESARRAAEHLLERSLQCGQKLKAAEALHNLTTLHLDMGEQRRALQRGLLCVTASTEMGHTQLISRIHGWVAMAHAMGGDFRGTELALGRARIAVEQTAVKSGPMMLERAEAFVRWEAGLPAHDALRSQLSFAIKHNYPVDWAPLFVVAASCDAVTPEGGQAFLSLLRTWHNKTAEGRVRFGLALIHEREGRREEARAELERSSRLAPGLIGLEGLQIQRLLMRARMNASPAGGAEFARQAFHLALANGRLRLAEEAAELAGDLVRLAGNPAGAVRWYREALRVFDDRRQLWFEKSEGEGMPKRRDELERKQRETEVDGPRDSWLKRILELDRELMGEHDVDRLLRRIIDGLIEMTGAERGFLLLAESGEWRERIRRGYEKEDLRSPDHTISRTIAERAARLRKLFITADAQNDDDIRNAASVREGRLHSVLCVPLVAGAKCLGVVYLDNRHRTGVFETVDSTVVEMFGDRAALALHNATLISAAKRAGRERAAIVTRARSTKRSKPAADPGPRHPAFAKLIGSSPALAAAVRILERAAASDVPVLICGETGTGKELAARGVHDASPRSRRPFVAVNCSAIAPTLLESELFGHKRGSFTGAEADRAGLFQQAHGGTLFLDEIGEMPKELQPKLLRALQEGEVRRVGSVVAEKVDVRVVAASNRDLEQMVLEGGFRRDLYFRLKGLVVILPPLRDRREDIPTLLHEFLGRQEKKHGSRRVAPQATELLIDYGWPGNVRELERVVEALVTLSDGAISPDLVNDQLRAGSTVVGDSLDMKATLEKTERALLAKALETSPSLVAAAKRLGIVRSQLYRLMERYGLSFSR